MNKFSLWLFYIFTFGIGYFILKSKAKKQSLQVNNELTLTNDIPIDVNKLIEYLGGQENIIDTSATISSIKISVKNVNATNQSKIKELGAKGVMLSDGTITCLFGDFSKELSKKINQIIGKLT